MTIEELYALLDLETGEDFQYFENLSDLIESNEDIDNDLIYKLLCDVDINTFAELTESYFYDVTESVPGDQIDVYNIIDNVKRVFVGLCEAAKIEEEKALLSLADEIEKYRNWYHSPEKVEIRNLSNGDVKYVSVCDALTTSRLEKLESTEYAYDFNEVLNYEIEEYIMTYADLISE